nr:MAG TPA: hypothetical protein [Caudoviricetes sp.]
MQYISNEIITCLAHHSEQYVKTTFMVDINLSISVL